MPPRIDLASCLGSLALCLRPVVKPNRLRHLPIASTANVSSKAQRRKHRDPYALAQAQQRKAANLTRREVLRKEREEAIGDPVRGITTPFLESFDNATPPPALGVKSTQDEDGNTYIPADLPLNHFIKPSELKEGIQHSFILTQPMPAKNTDLRDPAAEAEEIRRHAEAHERATAAVSRILSLANASQKDRTRFNIQRCIETFGRHNTDAVLTQRAPSIPQTVEKLPLVEKAPRAGPDTGSSEVQIAILTAKIRVLADQLERPHYQKDKVNKRNLRVLVHRRQRLLQYLRRKERGSQRYQNVVETLGLTEGTWKGEISL